MTYYNNYEILTEANEQQTPQVSPERFDTIMDDYVARDKQRSNLSVKLKLTHSLFDAIDFPSVPANFKNIMKPTFFPDKFKNVNNMLDPDPSTTINNATDFAVKSFSGLGTLSLAPKQQKNESIEYDSNNVLNETALASLSYQLGKIAGVVVSDVVGGGIVGVASGVVQTAGVPIAATAGAAFGLGALVARLSPDNAGNYHEDDKKLLQKYGLEQNNGKISNNKDVIQAIDNYINNVQAVVRTLLLQVASKTSKANINKLMTLVNKLNAGALAETTDWIDAHREEIVKFSEHRANKDRENLNAMESINIRLEKWLKYMMENPNIPLDVKKELRNTLTVSNRKKADALDDVFDKVKPNGNVNSSYNVEYSKKSILNEEDTNISTETLEQDVKLPEFNADVIYETVLRNIQEAVNQVLEADKEEWPKVIWAKERMQELKKGATEQINKQIEIVCRMGNGESMPKGLSGTVTDFIVKHPMRAENLKALWKRHEADLDLRIQRRIEAITNPTGPCEAVYTFLQTTYPTLMAMMITYKALLAFMRENDSSLMRPMDDTYKENVKKETQLVKDSMINNFKLAYDLAGGYLNKTPGEQTIVYDVLKNIFTSELNYGGAIVYQMLKQNKRKDVASQYGIYAEKLDELLPKNADIYFKKMGCVLSECGKVEDATSVNKLIKLMEAVGAEKEQMQKVIDKINASKEKIKAHSSEHLNNLLKLILATRGEFINYYKDCGDVNDEKQWETLKNKLESKYVLFQHKDDKGNLNKKDKQDTKHNVKDIIVKYDQALKEQKFDLKTVIDSVNQEEYFNVIFNAYYNCFFVHLLTNVKDKPNLTFIDYDVLITILDMMASNLPRLVSTGLGLTSTALKNYVDYLDTHIFAEGQSYEPAQDEKILFGYPEVNSSEIENYEMINKLIDDDKELEVKPDDDKTPEKTETSVFGPGLFADILERVFVNINDSIKEFSNLNIDEKYKVDSNDDYVKKILGLCGNDGLFKSLKKLLDDNKLIDNEKDDNIDEFIDRIKRLLHCSILLTFKKFNEQATARINFEEIWSNSSYDIRTSDGKTSKFSFAQICALAQQVHQWLYNKPQIDQPTQQQYHKLKELCNDAFKKVYDIKFDKVFDVIDGGIGNEIINSAKTFKNQLPTSDAGEIINALDTMLSSLYTAPKNSDVFKAYFECVCQIGSVEDKHKTNTESPNSEPEKK